MEFCVGQMVRSKAGRDNGTAYVVIRTDGDYIYVANGASRKLDNPKKKKIKHIEGSYNVSREIADMVAAGTAEDYVIRRFLKLIKE